MDKTQELIGIQKRLHSLIGHEAWGVARERLIEKITDLQNAFNIEDKTADEMLIDLRARKIATTILFDWLQDIEGTGKQYESNGLTLTKEDYIVRPE